MGAGLTAGLGRLPGWPIRQHPGLTAGLGRFPGRSSRVGLRPPCRPGPAPTPGHPGAPPVLLPPRPHCRPRPAPRPDHSGATPALLPAWAGCQAGPTAVLLLFFFQQLYFWSPYLRGFFPK